MSVKPLIQLSIADLSEKEPPLRTASRPVENFGAPFQKVVDDLVDTYNFHDNAIGLAAPQIGVSLRVAVFGFKGPTSKPPIIIVNPKILSTGDVKDSKAEACMSLPHYAGEVERSLYLELSYQDRSGREMFLRAEGFSARVVAHEVDHLNGLLYVDRMGDVGALRRTDVADG